MTVTTLDWPKWLEEHYKEWKSQPFESWPKEIQQRLTKEYHEYEQLYERSVAIHEAGHAVVAHLLNIKVEKIILYSPGSTVDGRVVFDGKGGFELKATVDSNGVQIVEDERSRKIIDQQMMRLVAGGLAVKLILGEDDAKGLQGDMSALAPFLKLKLGSAFGDGVTQAVADEISRLQEETEVLLKRRHVLAAIRTLADELLKVESVNGRKVLEGKKVRRTIAQALAGKDSG